MLATVPHLRAAIHKALENGQVFRVYQDSLQACWPHASDAERWAAISAFAAQNKWTVEFRELGAMGSFAEFRKNGLGHH